MSHSAWTLGLWFRSIIKVRPVIPLIPETSLSVDMYFSLYSHK
jgi:hypothetical protein